MRWPVASGQWRTLVLAMHMAALAAGLTYAWAMLADVAAQQATVDQRRHTVEQLDRRLAAGGIRAVTVPQTIDPFVAGTSATVAGANLQERIVSAIRTAGGTVTSSQIDTSGATASAGAPPPILLSITCQLSETELQSLLYGFEAGTPALFLDQLSVEIGDRAADPAAGGGRLKISLTVSAFWRGEGRT